MREREERALYFRASLWSLAPSLTPSFPRQDLMEEGQEETGWKLVHGDVFRPPALSGWLAVLVGTGVQVRPRRVPEAGRRERGGSGPLPSGVQARPGPGAQGARGAVARLPRGCRAGRRE